MSTFVAFIDFSHPRNISAASPICISATVWIRITSLLYYGVFLGEIPHIFVLSSFLCFHPHKMVILRKGTFEAFGGSAARACGSYRYSVERFSKKCNILLNHFVNAQHGGYI